MSIAGIPIRRCRVLHIARLIYMVDADSCIRICRQFFTSYLCRGIDTDKEGSRCSNENSYRFHGVIFLVSLFSLT